MALLVLVVALLVGCSGEARPADSRAPDDGTTPELAFPTIPPDRGPATQSVWDFSDIEASPLRPTRLPRQFGLAMTHGPTLQQRPMSGIVAALRDARGLRLLNTDGTWREVEIPVGGEVQFGVNDFARPAISADGTRVAVALEAGILVINATTGAESTIPWPPRFSGRRDSPPSVVWQPGDEGFIVFDLARTWLVALDGSHREAPFRSYAFAVDADGPIHQNAFRRTRLVTWEEDEVVDRSPFVQCERMVAAYGLVACTAGSLQPFRSGPVVVDPRSGEIVAYAPAKDRNSIYSDNGGLTLLGFFDKNTLLMLVGPAAFNRDGLAGPRILASWQFRTGEFQRISIGGSAMRSIAVAPALVE